VSKSSSLKERGLACSIRLLSTNPLVLRGPEPAGAGSALVRCRSSQPAARSESLPIQSEPPEQELVVILKRGLFRQVVDGRDCLVFTRQQRRSA
jgi:hypothetical protein